MGACGAEAIHHAAQVMGEIVEGERTVIVVAVAIAAGVPGDGVKRGAKAGS